MKRAMFLDTLLREAGRGREAYGGQWSLPRGGGGGDYELESQTAEQRQKSVTGTYLGCGIVG